MSERFKAFEGNLELVLFGKLGGIVQDRDVDERDDRHCGSKWAKMMVS
jgi:hypothetical protein